MKKLSIIAILLLFIGLSILPTDINLGVNNKNCCEELEKNNIDIKDIEIGDELTIENIYLFAMQSDIKFPEIVMAQCLLETGNLSSRICIENNNLFGMKYPFKRETTAISKRYNHANYRNWKDSVKDYRYYQIHFNVDTKYKTEAEYYSFLKKRGYATDKHYIIKLKHNKFIKYD